MNELLVTESWKMDGFRDRIGVILMCFCSFSSCPHRGELSRRDLLALSLMAVCVAILISKQNSKEEYLLLTYLCEKS